MDNSLQSCALGRTFGHYKLYCSQPSYHTQYFKNTKYRFLEALLNRRFS
jgi:hypothetical protein